MTTSTSPSDTLPLMKKINVRFGMKLSSGEKCSERQNSAQPKPLGYLAPVGCSLSVTKKVKNQDNVNLSILKTK